MVLSCNFTWVLGVVGVDRRMVRFFVFVILVALYSSFWESKSRFGIEGIKIVRIVRFLKRNCFLW